MPLDNIGPLDPDEYEFIKQTRQDIQGNLTGLDEQETALQTQLRAVREQKRRYQARQRIFDERLKTVFDAYERDHFS